MNNLIRYLKEALLFVNNPKENWKYAHKAIAAYFSDIWGARMVFPHIAGRGLEGNEKTISDMLENLCKDSTHPDHKFFWETALMINRRCPTHDHIKAVL